MNNIFFKARSLYRAGDKKGFDTALQVLIDRKDKNAGYLLIAVAADKRREKDFDGALQTYQEHPEHKRVVTFLRTVHGGKVSVDYDV